VDAGVPARVARAQLAVAVILSGAKDPSLQANNSVASGNKGDDRRGVEEHAFRRAFHDFQESDRA